MAFFFSFRLLSPLFLLFFMRFLSWTRTVEFLQNPSIILVKTLAVSITSKRNALQGKRIELEEEKEEEVNKTLENNVPPIKPGIVGFIVIQEEMKDRLPIFDHITNIIQEHFVQSSGTFRLQFGQSHHIEQQFSECLQLLQIKKHLLYKNASFF